MFPRSGKGRDTDPGSTTRHRLDASDWHARRPLGAGLQVLDAHGDPVLVDASHVKVTFSSPLTHCGFCIHGL